MKPGDEGWDYSLERYIAAQDYIVSANIQAMYAHKGPTVYDRALQELTTGKKETHWMWFIFPQIKGIGMSKLDHTYSIKSLDEARKYLEHPILGKRIIECVQAVLNLGKNNPEEIFSYPDNLKLRSCMTLFEIVENGENNMFGKLIDEYYYGERDQYTIQILEEMRATKHIL